MIIDKCQITKQNPEARIQNPEFKFYFYLLYTSDEQPVNNDYFFALSACSAVNKLFFPFNEVRVEVADDTVGGLDADVYTLHSVAFYFKCPCV